MILQMRKLKLSITELGFDPGPSDANAFYGLQNM